MYLELLAEGSERHTGHVSRKQIRIGIWSPECLGDILFARYLEMEHV